MNETKRERLFDGVTGIRDDLVEEAAAIPAKRNRWQSMVTAVPMVSVWHPVPRKMTGKGM